ncbi:UPF0187-domain-containing protein [Gigaspora margarita]|uniref:UPF0187-domain-containing protein n=1 Tax=Gigaspora margarita TaxID=4874 RepID=A0A8H4A1B3_GIGMA|nr:UPF0187-domain-containing protein [Gigaspora margarita]
MSKKNIHTHDDLKEFYTPYVDRPSSLFAWRRSVLPKVIPQALLIAAFSALIVGLWKYTTFRLGIKSNFISITTFVVSLLLAYRTNTAYDRYWEGRRLWSTMITAIRNLARFIWVNVPNLNENKIDPEKSVVFELLAGYAIATKHFLREEDASRKLKIRLDMEPLNDECCKDDESRLNKLLGKLLIYRSKTTPMKRQLIKPDLVINHNLPLEISLYLNYYISQLKRREPIEKRPDDPSITQMYANVSILTDCLSSLERVLRSPIPFAYAIHLLQTTWLFCLSLPFQLVQDLEWVTVPIAFFASMILLGVEEIASEIENPFGRDPNDLKLDEFCKLLEMELDFVKSHHNMANQWKSADNEQDELNELKEQNELNELKESHELNESKEPHELNESSVKQELSEVKTEQ